MQVFILLKISELWRFDFVKIGRSFFSIIYNLEKPSHILDIMSCLDITPTKLSFINIAN